jgi:aryl carrier-like protein
LVARADVANLEEMQAAVATARERFGPVQGVVHAAGLPGGGVAQLKDPKVAAAVFAPKIGGARVLEQVLAGEPLDFFVLCSSTIAVYGNFGQIDYCAANSFLDAFAEDFAARRGALALSINYGAWRDVGMAVHARVPTATAPEPLAGPPLHPLVHALVENREDRKVFASRLTAGDLWVIDEHKVAKAPTVPGTGCLEMARAAYNAAFGAGPVELAEVFFLSPLRVPGGLVKEARVTLERSRGAEGDWDFRIASRSPGEPKWQDHAFGKVRAGTGELGRRDLGELAARTGERTDEIDGKLLDDPEALVWWGPRWQSLRRVHVGDGEALARLELPEEFAADLAVMPLHPALLDVATAIAGLLEEGSHLPFSYRRLRFAAALPAKLWSSIRRRPDAGSDMVTADVSLLDDEGRAVVEIEGFSLKSVGEAAGRFEQTTEPPSRPEAGPTPAAEAREALLAQSGMSPAEGLEAFRRILAARPGRQVAVSPRDLRALLEQMERTRAQGLDEAVKAVAPRDAHPRSVQTTFVAPRTELERRLAEIWQAVLGIDAVGVDDNFYEMGGDSVLGIQIIAAAREGGIELQSSQLFEHQTIAALAAVLGDTVAPARPTAPRASAERFALAGIPEEALVRVLGGREAEDAYPLSPLQQGFLFDTLAAGGSAVYIEQITCTLIGAIDAAALGEAWQRAVDRHPALRTWFAWEDLDRPLQIVAPRAELPVEIDDLRELAGTERAARVEALRKLDRETPFDLAKAPLMRVRLLRTEEATWEVTWSHHHLLIDGWSSPMLVVEVLATYEALRRGESPAPPPTRPFRDYIAWLAERDLGEAERFFRRYLAGLAGPTPLAADRADDGQPRERADFVRFDARIEPELEVRVREASRREQATLSIVVATAWLLLLGQEAGSDDVVYGVSVSGRPPELAGVERVVGCFINALPVRARLDRDVRVADWLRTFQVEQGELLEYSYAPLVEAQRWAGLPADRGLFETAFEFWNFPFARPEGQQSFEMRLPDYDVATNLPLSLRAMPQEGLMLQLTYDRRRFDAATIEHKMRKLTAALAAIAERPAATLGEIAGELAALDRERLRSAAATVSDVAREKLKARRRSGVSAPEA